MQITLAPIPITPPKEYKLMADDKQIGTVKRIDEESKHYNYHVIVDAKYQISLCQGFGLTVDEALRDAFERAKKYPTQALAELNELENVIWGDHEIN